MDNPKGEVLAYSEDLKWIDVKLDNGKIVSLSIERITEYKDLEDWETCYYCK